MAATAARHVETPTKPRRYASFEVDALTPHIGAVVRGIDLSQPMGSALLSDLRAAWADWSVLVFRDQRLEREHHKALGRQFGNLHRHPMYKHGAEDPEILTVKTTANSAYTAGEGWHTDVTCEAIPPLGSMLYITAPPEGGGGDTLFADMYMAYEMLSPNMQRFLEGLTAVHDGAIPFVGSYKSTPPEGGYPRNEHPVVTRHPVTGRKVLYVNSGFTSHIVGMHKFESKALLDMLYRHIDSTPKLHCRVRWEANTLTMWDNRCTQHHAVWDYWPNSRYGERVTIVGDEPPSR